MSSPGEEVILRTIWGLRPFREAFLDSHKALVRHKSSTERESMLRVQTAFAKAFSSIRHHKKNQDRNRRRKEQKKKRSKRELKKNEYGKYVDNNVSDSSSDEEEEGNSLVPCLDVSALKKLKYSSARTKNYSMDGRIGTSSSLYDMMYMLYHPPDEQSQSLSTLNSSGGETFVVNESDHSGSDGSTNGSNGSTNRNNGTKKGTRSTRKRPHRKRARETWDLSNLFRHKVNVEWSTDSGNAGTNNDNMTLPHLAAAPRGATTLDSSALMSRTPRQRKKRKGNLLPDDRFRFWHVIDVGVMLDLHDEIMVQQESRDSMNDDEQSKNKDREEEELGFREQAVRDVLKEEQEEAQKSLAEAMAAANAAALVAETNGRPQKDLVNDEKKQKFRDIYEQKIKRNIEKKTTTTTTTTTTAAAAATKTASNTFFCGGRENIIERITTDDDAKDRVRGHGDLSHVMRELLQLEAYEELQKKGHDDDNSNLSLRPILKLEMRPDILCIRLEWPSTKSLRTARMSINGKKFIWDTISMKHLHLYDCFDIIGGKRRDNRTPYNTKACTYTLTHVICSSLGMALDQKDHSSGSSKNKKKRTSSSSSSSSFSSSPSTYYGMSRIRKRKSVGEEKDAWKLISLGGDNMKDEFRYTSSNGDYNDEHDEGQPIPEAMRMIDLRKICHERKVFPEFLFFESNGPTPRDLRSQERRNRVSSSAMLDTSTPPTITTSRSSDGRSGGGYGTIAQSKGRYDDDIEKHPFGNTSMDVNWCEASCTIG